MAKKKDKKKKDKKKKDKKKDKKKSKEKKLKISEQVDKYDLYIRSVQDFEHEVQFFNRIYREKNDRDPVLLREDFCGTFGVCCEWVKCDDDRQAIGVDLDPEPLNWGKLHLASRLKQSQRRRIRIMKSDVRDIIEAKADILAAQNFSFWLFKSRETLKQYFECMFANLDDDGLAVLDMFGGFESMTADQTDKRKIDVEPVISPEFQDKQPATFSYEWEQASLDAITHDATYHIHFAFNDGSRLDHAFTYEWRFWTIPEVQELLLEAGFKQVDVYWDIADHDDEESQYEICENADNDAAWICYIVASK